MNNPTEQNSLAKLDRYLLINLPALWATQLHYTLYYGVILLFLNIVAAYLIPVTFNMVPNPTFAMIYLGASWVIFFMWWLSKQRLLGYQRINGITGRFFLPKILFTAYSVILFSALIHIVPFLLFKQRIENQYIDKGLPALNLTKIQSSINGSAYLFEHPDEDIRDLSKKTLDSLVDFSSGLADSTHSFRLSSLTKLSNEDLVQEYLLNSGLGVDSIITSPNSQTIHIYYFKKAPPKYVSTLNWINYRTFKDRQISTKLYKDQITLRTYYGLDNSHKIITPLNIYFYRSPNSPFYRFCDEKTIQASLLVDKMITSIHSHSIKDKLDKLNSMIGRVQPVEKLTFFPFIIALTFCLFIISFAYLSICIDMKYISSIFVFCTLPTLLLMLFLPSVGQYLDKNWLIPTAIIVLCCIIVFILAKRQNKSDLTIHSILTATFIPACLIFAMAVTVNASKLDGNILFNSYFIELLNRNQRVTYATGLIVVFFLPWYFAEQIRRLSFLPLK